MPEGLDLNKCLYAIWAVECSTRPIDFIDRLHAHSLEVLGCSKLELSPLLDRHIRRAYAVDIAVTSKVINQLVTLPGEQIELDGATWVLVDQDTTNGWSYDVDYSIVYFHGDAMPPRDATIKIDYEVVPGSQTNVE